MNLLPEIKGGVEVKGSVIPFSTLIERKMIRQEKEGAPYVWEFDKSVQGVFSVGGVEVFFGFADPPPEILKPKPKREPEPVAPRKGRSRRCTTGPPSPRDLTRRRLRGDKHREPEVQGDAGYRSLAVALLLGAVTDRLILVVKESKAQILRRAPSARWPPWRKPLLPPRKLA
jgi:hypothetical protein